MSRRATRSPLERFIGLVDNYGLSGCWTWRGGTDHKGYGRFICEGQGRAHRWSYQHFVGRIPEGMQVDHTCFVRNCVNPEHLRLVTPKQNSEHLKGAHRDSRTGIRGVSYHRQSGKYFARVHHNGVCHSGGYFETAEQAGAAAQRLRDELYTHDDAPRPF